MTWATSSATATSCLPRSPSAAAATPVKIENTTICRISLFAIASTIDFGTRWVTNSLERQRRDLEVGRCARFRQRQAEIVARPQDVDHHHAEGERDQRGHDEPRHRLEADPANRLGIAHVSDADH